MIRLYLWSALTLALLACALLAAVYEPADQNEGRKMPAALSHSFTLGGVFVPASTGAASTPSLRDPFAFAPLALSVPEAVVAGSVAAVDFSSMTLEGVLVRKKNERAFLRMQGRAYSVGIGETLDNGVRVEAIDRDGVVVSNGLGESRRLHLAPR